MKFPPTITMMIVIVGLIMVCQPAAAEKPDDLYEKTTVEERLELLNQWHPRNEVERMQKQVILAEYDFNYTRACAINEKLIKRRDLDDRMRGLTHVALQRCYAHIGKTEKEKRELIWIQENIFSPLGKYRFVTNHLTQNTLADLEQRHKKLVGPADFSLKPQKP